MPDTQKPERAVNYYLTADSIESLLAAVVPSGSVCDPQQVADAIRGWFAQATTEESSADASPLPTPEEARKHWGVVVYAGGHDLINLRGDGGYSGLAAIEDYADIVRLAARHLDSFIGHEGEGGFFPECSGDPACCPENEGYGCCRPNPPSAQPVSNADELPRSGDAPVAVDRGALVRHAIKLLQAKPAWDGKTFDPEVHHTLQLLATHVSAPAQHSDDAAVDRFAVLMKQKLAAARAKGRGGWDDPQQCDPRELAELLCGHIGKANDGNYTDIANFCMMLTLRDAPASLLGDELNRYVKWCFESQPISAPAQAPHTDAQLDEILERPVCEGESVGFHLHHGCNVPGSNQSTRLLMREVLRTILRGVSAPATQPGPAEFTEDRRRAYAPAKIAGPEDMAIYDGIARRYLDSFEPMVPATPGARIIPRGFVDGSAGAPADARDADSDAELIEALHINLKAAREFADRNSRDARRYRIVRRGQHWSVVDGSGEALRAEALDVAVDIYVDRAFGVNGTPECGSEQDERDREVGRKWRTNSALEEWFPLTADQLARAEADSKRIDYIAREYLEITPFDMPTGADDADVGWRIYEFHQSAPHKSLVAEEFRDDLRAAIDRAMGGES